MAFLRNCVWGGALGLLIGCGAAEQENVVTIPQGPISLEVWKELPLQDKYDGETLEQLRESDRKLKSDRAWNQFMQKVVIPERNKDTPKVSPTGETIAN